MGSSCTKSTEEHAPNEVPMTPVEHIPANNLEGSNPRWDGMCERCLQIPWEALIRAKTGTDLASHGIRLDKHLDPENCRLCRLFSRVYSSSPYGIPDVLCPDGSQSPSGPSQQFRSVLDILEDKYEIRWMLTDRNPEVNGMFADYVKSMRKRTNFRLVRSWIDQCNAQHAEACKPAPTALIQQLRLIDCNKKAIVPAPVNCEFIALSYAWGQSTAAQAERTTGLHDLPKTIADAVLLTRELGYSYLWVDRYVSCEIPVHFVNFFFPEGSCLWCYHPVQPPNS